MSLTSKLIVIGMKSFTHWLIPLKGTSTKNLREIGDVGTKAVWFYVELPQHLLHKYYMGIFSFLFRFYLLSLVYPSWISCLLFAIFFFYFLCMYVFSIFYSSYLIQVIVIHKLDSMLYYQSRTNIYIWLKVFFLNCSISSILIKFCI